jgi:UDP-N-acetylmuramate--alanine ligase
MLDKILDNNSSFYFIGIGGVSMSALAKLLKGFGKTVAGCDLVESEYTKELALHGIKVSCGEVNDSIEAFDAVVYTDAVKENNFQLSQAISLNKPIVSRGQLLGEICKKFSSVIAVCGCHGKTTCTAMISHIFNQVGKKFTCHIGGRDLFFGNYYCTGRDYFITEACEYKKNFLFVKPNIGLILNTRADHLECYGSREKLRQAYLTFAENCEKVICLYGDLPVQNAITFGYDDRSDYYASRMKKSEGKFSFVANEGDKILGRVQLNVFGKHNVLNAIAAIAVARSLGLPFEEISDGLNSFTGVERRFESLGTFQGCECIADYAHHPDEIRAALKTAKLITRRSLYVVFQPHTYSRTKNLFKEFVNVLSSVENLLIYKTFAAREYFDDAGCALTLSQAIKKSVYGDSSGDIVSFLQRMREGDVALFLGAGDIYYIAKNLICD